MLRILPWVTDGAVSFLDGFIYNRSKKRRVSVFEFGLGNSTLYFLSRKCNVFAVDHDEAWVNRIRSAANLFGFREELSIHCLQRPYNTAYKPQGYDIISIDGRDRVLCLKTVLQTGLADEAILLLDNTERVANGKYADYVELLKGEFTVINFEQPCVQGVSSAKGNYHDRSGNRAKHRWITTVAYKKDALCLTTSGNPL